MANILAFAHKHEPKIAALVFAVIVAALGLHTLNGFWRGDDSAILAYTLKHPLRDIFFSPVAWQEFSSANLTPWVSLSFYLDYALAGLNPALFYLHQMLSLWLVTVMASRLFSLFMHKWLALAGTLLFVLGTPVLRISDQLMTRHYLEGLLLGLLAVYFFLRHQQSGKQWQLVVAALSYLLAVTAKETYVPLGVLLILLASGSWSQRVRQAWPFVVVIGLYAVWRRYMLPALTGGYSQDSVYLTLQYWQDVLLAFSSIPAILFGSLAVFIAVPMFVVIAAGTVLQRRAWLWTVVIAGMVLIPLIPLVVYPGITAADRYLLLPWFVLCFAFVFHADALLRPLAHRGHRVALDIATLALCLILAALLLLQRMRTYNGDAPYYHAIDTQMHFVQDNDNSRAFVPETGMATSFWMIIALGDIKHFLDPSASSPKPVVDDIFLDDSLPLFQYSAECRCMQDISATIPQRMAQFSQSRHAPLGLTISNNDGLVSWNFGPYGNGSYNVVSKSIGNIRLPASRTGFRTSIHSGVDFYLRYTAPEGWSTYSPLLHLEPNGEILNWSRE